MTHQTEYQKFMDWKLRNERKSNYCNKEQLGIHRLHGSSIPRVKIRRKSTDEPNYSRSCEGSW